MTSSTKRARDDEEHIDPDKAATKALDAGMEQQNRQNRQKAQTVDIGTVRSHAASSWLGIPPLHTRSNGARPSKGVARFTVAVLPVAFKTTGGALPRCGRAKAVEMPEQKLQSRMIGFSEAGSGVIVSLSHSVLLAGSWPVQTIGVKVSTILGRACLCMAASVG